MTLTHIDRAGLAVRLLRGARPLLTGAAVALVALLAFSCATVGSQVDASSIDTRRAFVALGIALVSFVAGFAVGRRVWIKSIPPGPRPKKIKVKGDGTVIVTVDLAGALDKTSYLSRATLRSPLVAGEVQSRSRVIITAPNLTKTRRPQPIYWDLDEVDHLQRMTDTVAANATTTVDLEFKVPAGAHVLELAEAKVLIECWYIFPLDETVIGLPPYQPMLSMEDVSLPVEYVS